jgi:UDP-N-acetylmuramate--alanine ligase
VKFPGARIHFVGAGGVGVSALAELAHLRGARVTGSDLKDNEGTARLRGLGIAVFPAGHRAEHVAGAELVVHTSACPPDHVELAAARAAGVPVMRRAEFLAACVADRRTIAIGGAHGKTTTTAMTGAILAAAGLDPTVLVGGYLRDGGSNVRAGAGEWAVVEADEYDRSFLALSPEIALVNNVDREHLDIYRDMDDLRATFAAFASKAGPEGRALLCADDAEAAGLRPRIAAPTATYGLRADADVRATDVVAADGGSRFRLVRGGAPLGEVVLRVPGLHNVRNALGAASAAFAAGADFAAVQRGLAAFSGVGRRFERLGERDGVLVVDDYAHHPSEIRATLAAARATAPDRRLVALFQPHLYTRTRDLAPDFARELAAADVVILAPVYGSREAPLPGVTSALIAAGDGLRGRAASSLIVCASRDEIAPALTATLRRGDLLLAMGAGDVRAFAESRLRDVR